MCPGKEAEDDPTFCQKPGDPHYGASRCFILGRRGKSGILDALGADALGDQKGQLQRLTGVEPGIAGSLIARLEIQFLDRLRPAQTFGDVLAGHLEMHAAGMGAFGAVLMPRTGGVLTHCNAGALATCGYGTALGVIRAAVERGSKLHVYADETRPFLQGARLTAWELLHDNIPTTVLCDNMAASQMRAGKIKAVIVGADRIAANGDVANKIGTYGVAVLAKEHGIPFYVAAPWSTIDMATPTGEQIPIEERAAREVTHFNGKQITPSNAEISNPAFDVTPAKYVTAIITELGVLQAPYDQSLRLGTEQVAHPA